MAGEIQIIKKTGLTLYAILRNNVGQAYNTSGAAFETYATANIADYDIALAEQGTASGYYVGTMPTVAAGIYAITVYKQAGVSPSEANDKAVGWSAVHWSGTALAYLSAVSVAELQAAALADMFNTNSGTNYAGAVTGSPVKEIADNAGGSALTVGAIADAVWDEARSGHVSAGTFGEYVLADAIKISGDTTAADNAEAMFDGTGYAGGTIKLGVDAVAISGDSPAADNLEAMLDGTGSVTLTTNITGNITGNLSGSVGSISGVSFPTNFGDLAITSSTGRVDVGKWVGTVVTIGATSGKPDVNIEAINDDATKAGYLDTMIGNGTFTANITGNLSGSVSSVTGNVGGNVVGSVASVTAGVDLSAGAVDDIWDESQSGHTTAGTFGKYLDAQVSLITSGLTASSIADAVWDEARSGHVVSGSFGEGLASVQGDVTGNVDGNVGGNVTGSVGSIDGVTFPTNFADLAITASDGRVDVGEWLGTAVTLSSSTSLPEVDATSISDSGSAADAVEANIGNLDTSISGLSIPSAGSIADAVWDEMQSGHTDAGSFGAYLDQAISDITIPTANAIADQVWDEARADHTSAGSFGEGVKVESLNTQAKADVNAEADTALTDYDALVAADLPTNFGSLSIDGSGRVDVGSWIGTAVTLSATTALPEVDATSISDSGAAADAVEANIGNLDAAISSISPPSAGTIADAVWDEAQSGHTTAGTFGKYLDSSISGISIPTAASVADAVWDEARAGHVSAGTFGEGVIAYSLATQAKADVNAEADTALTDYDALVPADLPTNFASLSIDVSGRVDLGSWLGTAVTLSSANSLPEVDATTISDSGTAADNVEANIGNLDAAITSRAPASTALSSSTWTNARAGYLDNLNVSGTLAHSDDAATYKADVSGLATAAALATVDTNIDTLVTRIPDTLSLANINAEVDTALTDYDALVAADLPTNFASLDIDANGRVLIQGTINDLDSLNNPTVAQIADGVWDEAAADHNTVGTTGAKINIIASGSGTATLDNQEAILALVQARKA